MKKTTLFAAPVLLACVTLVGCSKAPEQGVIQAQEALAAADSVEADLYVAELYTAAQDSFAAAQIAIEAENARSSFSRDYDRAESLLAAAISGADEAAAQVEIKKEEVRVGNETLLAEAQAAVAQAQMLLTTAPRGKDGAVALVAIQEDAGTAAATLDQALAAQSEGAFAQARDLAATALAQANALIEELNAASAKTQTGARS